jgi:phosphoribosylglycinamide formyltransferase-1
MKIVILGSGNGSNALAILKLASENALGEAKIVGVFSDVADAGILKHAKDHAVSNKFINPGTISSKLTGKFEDNWIGEIKQLSPDLIVLAGFMRVIKQKFLTTFRNRIINLHPSLLPSFPGLNSIKQAFDKKVKITGCTVHWVNEKIDGGEIIAQAPVRVMEGDTLLSITQKVHAAEHMLLPSVIKGLSDGNLSFPV